MPQNITVTIARIILANRVTSEHLIFEPPNLFLKGPVEPENDEQLHKFLMSVVEDPRVSQGKWCARIQVTPSTHAAQNYALQHRTLRSEWHIKGEEEVYRKHAGLLSNLYSSGCEKLHALLSAFIQEISEKITLEMVTIDLGIGTPVMPWSFTSKTDDVNVEMRLNSRPFMFTPLDNSDEADTHGMPWDRARSSKSWLTP